LGSAARPSMTKDKGIRMGPRGGETSGENYGIQVGNLGQEKGEKKKNCRGARQNTSGGGEKNHFFGRKTQPERARNSRMY